MARRLETALSGAWATKEERSLVLRAVLGLIGSLRRPLAAAGVDFTRFRELLRVKLVLALRGAGGSAAMGEAAVALTVVFCGLGGLLTGLAALLQDSPGPWLVLSLGSLLILVGWVLLTQLASILVDPADIGVVAPHPVPDRTLFSVRLAQLFAYVAVIAGSHGGGNVLLAVWRQPPLPVLLCYPVLVLLAATLALGAVALLFALLLHLAGPARFQRVSFWVQILGGVALFVAVQVGMRSPLRDGLADLGGEPPPWLAFLPPFHYVAVFELARGGDWREHALPALAAFLCPLGALAATLALASRYFVAGLQGSLAPAGGRARRWPAGPFARLGARLARSREERAGFDFTLALSRREPRFLRAVVPMLGMFSAMGLIGAFRERTADLSVPFTFGFPTMVLATMLDASRAGQDAEARWLFLALPLRDESALVRGAARTFVFGWWVPIVLVLALALTLILGPGALPAIVLALELWGMVALALVRCYALGIPFTRTIRFGEMNVRNFGVLLVLMLVWGLVCAVFFLLASRPWSLWGGIALLVPVLWRLDRGLDRVRVAEEYQLLRRHAKPASRSGGADRVSGP